MDNNDIQEKKYSIGIACVRIRDNKPEVLMIRKRFTYAYYEFATGKYKSFDQKRSVQLERELLNLFNEMTVEEKLDILSLDFGKIWYRLWLTQEKSPSFLQYKLMFDSMFLVDNGDYLREIIGGSTNAQYVWEMPKGRRNTYHESDLACAIREFHEETNIAKRRYRIIPGLKRSFSHVDKHVEYTNTYYVALTNHEFDVTINCGARAQISEIGDIRWMSIEAIRVVDYDKRMTDFAKSIFSAVKKITKIPR